MKLAELDLEVGDRVKLISRPNLFENRWFYPEVGSEDEIEEHGSDIYWYGVSSDFWEELTGDFEKVE